MPKYSKKKMEALSIKTWNTKRGGVYEFFVYPKKKGGYIGVCLTLDIIDEGADPHKVMESLKQAALGHILVVIRENLRDELLNRPAPKKNWDKYKKFLKQIRETEAGWRLWRGALAGQESSDALQRQYAKRTS